MPQRRSIWISWLLGLAALAAVVLVAIHFSEAREFARLVERAEPWWLVMAAGLQAGTYLAQAEVFRRVAVRAGVRLGLGPACRLGFAKLFMDQAVPSAGLSGTVLLATGLRRRGVPRPVIAAGIVVDLVSYYAAYVIGLAAALAIGWARGETTTIVLIASLVFSLVAVAIVVLVLSLSGRSPSGVSRRLAGFRPMRALIDFVEQAPAPLARGPRLLAETTGWQLAIVLCDAATV